MRRKNSPLMTLLIGAILLFAGINYANKYSELKDKCTAETTGRVFYVEKSFSRKTGKYNGYVNFTVDDKTYTIELGSKKFRSNDGSTVAVAYDPDDPSTSFSPTIPPNKGIVYSLLGAFSVFSFFAWLLYKIKLKPHDK